MTRSTASLLTLGLASAWLLVGCNDHEPVQAFRSTVFIGERGISIPLPPPSVLAAPEQEVDVEGAIEGDLLDGGEVRLLDGSGGDETAAPLDEDGHFRATLELDLTDSCIEAWILASDGTPGTRRYFSTSVSDDEQIVVREGCE